MNLYLHVPMLCRVVPGNVNSTNSSYQDIFLVEVMVGKRATC